MSLNDLFVIIANIKIYWNNNKKVAITCKQFLFLDWIHRIAELKEGASPCNSSRPGTEKGSGFFDEQNSWGRNYRRAGLAVSPKKSDNRCNPRLFNATWLTTVGSGKNNCLSTYIVYCTRLSQKNFNTPCAVQVYYYSIVDKSGWF